MSQASPTAPTDDRANPCLPWALAALTFVGALLAAALHRGRAHPDEVFQVLEPAHRLAFGTGELTWEWVDGVRNWAVPGLVAGLLRLADALGAQSPWALVAPVWVACALLQGAGTVWLYRLVEERDGRTAAALAGLVHATWGGYLAWAARPLGDALAIPLLLGGLRYTQRARDDGRAAPGAASGLLLGLAVVVRYGSLVLLLPPLWSLARARRGRALAAQLGAGAAVASALAALDWATWGQPLHSLWRYAAFNQPAGQVVRDFITRPWHWYLSALAGMVPLLLLPAFVRGLRRANLLVGCFALYALAICAHPHKEARFALPLVPLWVIIAAGPASEAWARVRSVGARRGLVALQGVWALAGATVLLPISFHRPIIDGEARCSRLSEAVIYAGTEWWQGGGWFYLHRAGPLFLADRHSPEELAQALADPRYACAVVEGAHPPAEQLRTAGFAPFWSAGPVVAWRRCPGTQSECR